MTPTSVLVGWTAWGGDQPIFYITNHRVTGDTAWIPNPRGLTQSLGQAIDGLSINGLTYDLRIQGSNESGVAFSSIVNFTTPVGIIVSRDVAVPTEFVGRVVVARDVAVPAEFFATPTPTGTTIVRDIGVFAEWTGPTGTTRDFTVPVDIGSTPLAPPNQVQNLVLSNPTTTSLLATWDDLITGPIPQGYTMEWKRSSDPVSSFLSVVPNVPAPAAPFVVSRTVAVSMEHGGHVVSTRDANIPIEWGGNKGATRDVVFQVEFGGNIRLAVDGVTPLEFIGVNKAVSRDFIIPSDRRTTFRRDALLPIEWRATAAQPPPGPFYTEIDLGDGNSLTDPATSITWGLANQSGGIATINTVPNAASAPCDILVRTFSPDVIWVRDGSNPLLWRSWTGSAWVPPGGLSDPRFTNTPPGAVTTLAISAVTGSTVSLTWGFPTGTVIGGGFRARFKRSVDTFYNADVIMPCVGPSVGQFIDAAGRAFSINAAGRVVVNGTPDATTSSAALLLLLGTNYWYRQTGGTWFTKALFTDPWASAGTASPLNVTFSGLATGTNNYDFQIVAFNIAGDGPVVAISATSESPDSTTIPPATQITDSTHRVWTLVGGQMVVNGVPVADTSGVALELYFNHAVYQQTDTGQWWGPATSATGGPELPGDPRSGTTTPPGGTGDRFTDNFATFDFSKWARSGDFDDGGEGFFSANTNVTPLTEINTGGHLDLNLVKIGANRFGAPGGKTCFAGIIDTYNNGNAFLQHFGYWEFTCRVERLPGLGLMCFTLSLTNWPPNTSMPSIWTDGSGTMQLAMFCSGVSGSEYFISEGNNGWVGTDPHAYGFNCTSSVLEFYIDRVRVMNVPNPGGTWVSDPFYTKIHVQSNFYPDLTSVDTNALPRAGHCLLFNVWSSKPF